MMRRQSKISVALVACWLFAVTVVSDFLTFSSGSTTGSVEVFGETSLQNIVSAPSTTFTVWEFYTLMAPGATPTNQPWFTAEINRPEITTVAIFPPIVASSTLVTRPFTTTVEAIYTLVLASVTPVGNPSAGLPATNPSQPTTLKTSITSTSPPLFSPTSIPSPSSSHSSSSSTTPTPTPTPTPSPSSSPSQPATKAAAPVPMGECGRLGQASGNKCGG